MKITILKNLMQTKGFRYGGYASIITLAVVVGLVVVNLIVGQMNVQADLTSSGLYTLSDQTKSVLKKLTSEVTIYALYPKGQESKEVLESLRRYEADSSHVKVQVINPDQNPGFVKKYDKTGNGIPNGSLIIVGPKGFRVVNNADLYSVDFRNPQNPQVLGLKVEQQVTNALLYVTSGQTPVIYELTGHQETTIGQLQLSSAIQNQNFTVKTLNLVQTGKVPADASILLINNPTVDLSPAEVTDIHDYLNRNGHLFVMKDVGQNPLPNLNSLLAFYGVEYQHGIAVEMDSNHHTANSNFQLIPVLQNQDILKPIQKAGTPIVMPFAQGIKDTSLKTRDVQVDPLLTTTKNSFLRTDFSDNSSARLPSDVGGPITLAVAINNRMVLPDKPQFRLVVVGSSSFLRPIQPYGQLPGNLNFFLNSLSWLEHRTDTISISTKTVIQFPMRLTGTQVMIFSLLFVILIPLIIMIVGMVTWLRRRHL
jgi:ABC-type uncharacterized transport system involved in gliding motility auxiliary subunit